MSMPAPDHDPHHAENPGDEDVREDHGIAPLPGEAGIPQVQARRRISFSKKGLLAVGLLGLGLVAVAAYGIQRLATPAPKEADAGSKLASDRPTAATAEPRRLEIAVAPPGPAVQPVPPRIPALVPTADEMVEPIGVRRTGQAGPSGSGPHTALPEDAPVLLLSAGPVGLSGTGSANRRLVPGSSADPRDPQDPQDPHDPPDTLTATTRNLQGYQRQLQGLMDSLGQTAALATGQGAAPAAGPLPGTAIGPLLGGAASPGLFGGQLQGSATPRVAASTLGQRSLTLPKGTAFTCALKTKVISAVSGLVGCQVQRNVYSDDGRVLLVERGSHLDGEYRVTSVRPGTVRIPVLWTRIRTPLGVTVDIDSPGTGPLGESGIDGFVDNRWGERLGAAMLLSLIDDSVKLVIQHQTNQDGDLGQTNTVVLPSTTSNTSKLAEKVLDSTINIPPLIYQNQGGIVGIYVARDVDFSSVYALRALP